MMATQKSVEAVLKARDSNFTSTFSKASNILSKFSDSNRSATGSIRSIVSALGIYKAASAAASLVTGQLQSALGRADTMNNFNRNMTRITGSSTIAKNELEKLKAATKGTAYGLDGVATSMQSFANSGLAIDKSSRYAIDWMDAISAYGDGTTATYNQVMLQLNQMASKGKANLGDLKSAMEAGIPVTQILADKWKMTGEAVQNAISDGKISSEQFMDAMSEAFANGTDKFKAIAGESKRAGDSWKGTIDNMKAATTRGVLSVVNSLDTLSIKLTGSSIKEHITAIGSIFENNLTKMGNKLQQLGDTIAPYVQIFKTEFSGVGTSVVNATKSVLRALDDMYGGFGSTESVQNFGDVVKLVADKIKQASSWIQDHSRQIAILIPQVGKLALAYKGLQFISSLALPFIQFGEQASKGIEKLLIGSNSIGGKFTAKFIAPIIAAIESGTESLKIRAMLFSDGFNKIFETKLLGEKSNQFLHFFRGISLGADNAFPAISKLSNGFKTLGMAIRHPIVSLQTLSSGLIATSVAAGGTGTVLNGLGIKVSSGFKTMAVSGLGSLKSIGSVLLSTAGIFTIVVAAVAAMAVAWTSNFGNIQGFTRKAFAGMKPAFDSIKNSLASLKPVLSSAGDAFKTIGAVLIGTVVFAIAAVVDAAQTLIATFKSILDIGSAVAKSIEGVWKKIKGDDKGADEAFSQASQSLKKVKDNYTSVWDNSAIRGTISATSELGKETESASESQKRLSQAMDSTKESANQLSGTFSKLNQVTQDSVQKMQEAFSDNEVMQKFNEESLKLIEEGGKQRQNAIEKYNEAINSAENKSENERQSIMQKANAALMSDFQKSRSDLLAVNNEYGQMLASNMDKSGQQMNQAQRSQLVNARNAVIEELSATNQTYVDKLKERIALGDSISKEEANTALENLREANAQQVELLNTNNQEIKNLKQAQATSVDEMEKAAFQQEITNLENKNKALTEFQTAFGENWLALKAAQNQTTVEQLAEALANEKNLTDQNLLGILESYRNNGASISEQMTIMAAMLQEKGVEGANNLVNALKSGDVKAVGASITAEVQNGLGSLPPGMFVNGEKGRQNFINALKAGDTKTAGAQLREGVTSETGKTAQKTAQDGKNAAEAHNKAVENGKGGAKNAGSSLGNSGVEGLKSKAPDFTNAGRDSSMNYVHGVEYRRGSAKNAGTSLANSAKNGVSSVSGFDSIGRNMALGVASGINANAGSAVAAMQSLVDRVNAEARKKAEIKSPSQLFKREVGSFLALGVASGIEDKTKVAVNAMRNLIQKTSDVAVQGFTVDLGFSGEIRSDKTAINAKLDDLIEATREKLILDGAAIVGGHPDTIDKLGFENYQDRGRLSF
ncbi:tape measure protein [Lactococcus ileimucosae]|uniref:tape measure protein n=1 Tax=Lactococcus ileimucosae TaxID=2941329 RepID=UPI00204386B2|nr:tape measure protein [Lactococcus ileimucosae]